MSQQHTNVESLASLKQVARAYPRVPLHVVCDKYATHKDPNVTAWLAKNPRVQLHFTPTSGSWLNMVEIFFGIITRQAIRRGTFHSVKNLETAIGTYIDGWNERAHPFTWTKTADEIITHAKPRPHRKRTGLTTRDTSGTRARRVRPVAPRPRSCPVIFPLPCADAGGDCPLANRMPLGVTLCCRAARC